MMDLFVNTEFDLADKEWILLIQTAKMMGISIEEVRSFLHTCKAQENNSHNQPPEILKLLTNI